MKMRHEVRADGLEPDANATAPVLVTRYVSGSYFETVGTPLIITSRTLACGSDPSRWL